MSTGRGAFDRLLNGGTPERPVYAPLFTALAARIGNADYRATSSDPALWAAAVERTTALFDLDAFCFAADDALLAEACGAPVHWCEDRPAIAGHVTAIDETPQRDGRLAAFIEAARRGCQRGTAQRACVVAFPGPVTLAEQLFGADEAAAQLSATKQVANGVLCAVCEARPDLAVLLEGPTLAAAAPSGAIRRAYHTLRNVAGYFDVPLAVMLEGYGTDEVASFAALPCDVYVLGRAADGSLPTPAAAAALAAQARAIGLSLPPAATAETLAALARWREQSPRVFYTSREPARGRLEIEQVQAFVRALRAA
ncbi:MAG TPA: uroporphyrinogen decarboxylase family protein [Gammaproteobacteria bacterium]|nr:uroporphyrinogen decarboxylase family protein [Gammaproteobacteria bacterium]